MISSTSVFALLGLLIPTVFGFSSYALFLLTIMMLGAGATTLQVAGNPIMQLPWTNSGLPTLNMKSGTAENGLPLSLQMAARWNQDEILFAIGKGVEATLG